MSKAGLRDWIIQRLTAVYLAIYILLMSLCFLAHGTITFVDWVSLFHHTTFQVTTLVALLALCWHAWVGVWTIITDYINCPFLRMTVQAIVLLLLIAYFFWGIIILFWGLNFGL